MDSLQFRSNTPADEQRRIPSKYVLHYNRGSTRQIDAGDTTSRDESRDEETFLPCTDGLSLQKGSKIVTLLAVLR